MDYYVEYKKLKDRLLHEKVSVAMATDQLTRALAEVKKSTDENDFDKVSELGYTTITSEFIFLQRCIATFHECNMRIVEHVQNYAVRYNLTYEEAEDILKQG